MNYQSAVAIATLFFLGSLWGEMHADSTTQCRITPSFEGTITSVYSREIDKSQYVVRTKTECSILVATPSFPEYFAGQEVSVGGNVQALSEIPQEYEGYAAYLNRKEIDATMYYPSIRVTGGTIQAGERIRGNIRHAIERIFLEPEASVAKAMVLAERGSIPEEVTAMFEETGVSHILSISGLHISILTGLVVTITLLLPVSPLVRCGIVISILWAYIFLIGFPISALRAGMFWTFLLLALRLHVLVGLPAVLFLTAGSLVSVNPQIVMDVGFQLSFAAIAGIGLALFIFGKSARNTRNALVVSVGAFIGTWPIVSYHFGIISFVGIGLNLFIIPLTTIFLVSSIAAIVASSISFWLASVGGLLVHLLWKGIESVTTVAQAIPVAAISYTLPAYMVGLWYCSAFLIATIVLSLQQRYWKEIWLR